MRMAARLAVACAVGLCLGPSFARDFAVGEKTGAAIQKAIDAAFAEGGGRVVVPAGEYPSGSLRLRSRVELHLEQGARLVGGTKSEDYFSFPDEICAIKPEHSSRVFLYAWNEQDLAVTGEGSVDAQGLAFFDHSTFRRGFFAKPPVERPRLVQFVNCRGIRLEGVTFRDSPCWAMLIRLCEDITVDGIKIYNDQRMINSDGIDFDGCRHVRVKNSDFRTGDDCLIMRAMREAGDDRQVVCEDVVVTDCTLDSACQCVRMGCPSDDTIRNITFRNITLKGNIGLNFDYPARYLRPTDEGYMDIHDIRFENVKGALRRIPIRIETEPGVKIRSVRNVLFKDFDIRGGQPNRFIGNVFSKIENVRFENVTVNGERQPDGLVAADCSNAAPLKRVNVSSWETKTQKKAK